MNNFQNLQFKGFFFLFYRGSLLYCIVLYCIVLYCIVLYCIVLYCIVLYCIEIGIEIKFNDKGLPILSTETTGSVLAKEASRFLHFHVQDRFASTLLALPDQGKVGRALTTDTFANGSTWQYNGLNIRFRDWRFIHRARLNCLPVNSVKSRWSNSSPKCRRCDSDETLPHVLCHCRPNMPSILRRHNSIVDRIVNAVQRGSITTDQQVRAANSRLRPDIIVEEDKKVLIIDVCCPFDNNAEALRDAEQRKLDKYEGLKQFFVGQGKQCKVFGFVIGALGSWHPAKMHSRMLNKTHHL